MSTRCSATRVRSRLRPSRIHHLPDLSSSSQTPELLDPANKKRPRTVVRRATKPKQHKRSGSSDLDDFIADSDEDEGPYGGDSSDSDGGGPSFVPKSRAARETFASRLTNLVLLHGPHGSGKTSTVHAVAAELGWDVFEVYAGLGKRTASAMEKYVGDVARNHMAAGGTGSSPIKAKDAFAMFKKVARPTSPTKLLPTAPTAGGGSRTRQSLILIDEVDVLFNEEKDFWSGACDHAFGSSPLLTTAFLSIGLATLVASSRRPVIMTCSGEHSKVMRKAPRLTASSAKRRISSTGRRPCPPTRPHRRRYLVHARLRAA